MATTHLFDIHKRTETSNANNLENTATKLNNSSSKDVTPSSNEVKTKSEVEFVVDTDIFKLMNFKPGQPNLKKQKPEDPDRIAQKQKSGKNIIWDACKTHAMLQADYLNKQNDPKRLEGSKYRKELSALQKKRKFFVYVVEGLKKDQFNFNTLKQGDNKKPDEEFMKYALICRKYLISNGHAKKEDYSIEDVQLLCREFLSAYKKLEENNIYKFIDAYVKEQEVLFSMNLLKRLGIEPLEAAKKRVMEMCNQVPDYIRFPYEDILKEGMSLEKLALQDRHEIMVNVAHDILRSVVYNLRQTTWKPQMGFDALFKLFSTEKKPISFGGYFGQPHYNCPSKSVATIGNFDIQGWPPGSRPNVVNKEIGPTEIIVLGIERNPKNLNTGWIYYVDPLLPSDPKSDKSRIIYKISYERFSGYVLDNIGIPVSFDKLSGHIKDSSGNLVSKISSDDPGKLATRFDKLKYGFF